MQRWKNQKIIYCFAYFIQHEEHEHPDGTEKMPQDIKTEIIAQYRHNMRPIRIFEFIKERFGERFAKYNLSQLRYIIRKYATEHIPETINVGDLVAWAMSQKNVPEDLDTPFLLHFTQCAAQNTFNAVSVLSDCYRTQILRFGPQRIKRTGKATL